MVFGGAGGNALIEELNNGAIGTMPHCALPDLFRAVWDLYQSGDQSGASQAFDDFRPLRSAISNVAGGSSVHVVKEILHLRGIFKTTYVRNPAITPNSNTFSEVRRLAKTLKT
jgi:4-hydroxy-tetrahydrodipicolinate synthase